MILPSFHFCFLNVYFVLIFVADIQTTSLCSVHYPAYSLNVASMYLKLGRLYLGLEKKTQGVKALKKVCWSVKLCSNFFNVYFRLKKKKFIYVIGKHCTVLYA